MNNDAKTEKKIDLEIQNWHEEFEEFWPGHSKITKMYTLIGPSWPKYQISELKKGKEVIFDGTEYWRKRWIKLDLCFQK